VPQRRCRVTLRPPTSPEHIVEVSAASAYEAAALAVAEFRREEWATEAVADAAVLKIEVLGPAVQHQLRVRDVRRWLESTSKTPVEKLLKERLRGTML
jgi:hypothetical protein